MLRQWFSGVIVALFFGALCRLASCLSSEQVFCCGVSRACCVCKGVLRVQGSAAHTLSLGCEPTARLLPAALISLRDVWAHGRCLASRASHFLIDALCPLWVALCLMQELHCAERRVPTSRGSEPKIKGRKDVDRSKHEEPAATERSWWER